MQYKTPNICPVCTNQLAITRLMCHSCETKLEGDFTFSSLSNLPSEQLEFVEVFLKCRGNIKDVEKELGISYPTVRGRLDAVIQSLSGSIDKQDGGADEQSRRQDILAALQKGEISSQEAVKKLKKIR